MADILENVLIEGFDPEKFQDDNVDYSDKDWEQVYGAYQNKKFLQGTITGIETIGEGDSEKTCAIVHVGRIKGIIPLEFTGANNLRQLRSMTGQEVAFMILNYDREAELFTASRTKAQEEMAKITLRKISEGDIIPAVARHVTDKTVIADIGGITVRIPIDEVRYGWIDSLQDEVQVGQPLKVKVTKIEEKEAEGETAEAEKETRTVVKVSAKAAQKNPWPDCLKNYQRGGEYMGTVSGVREYGIFINLEPGVDSLATHLKFQNVKKGDKVLVRIQSIDTKEEQIRTRITSVK
ncbi:MULTISPECIES: S1 RNA-binding domain-containing protein [Oceanobacillus]|uniref:S1 RNA-binding domain-containing protein n=1 Tax=Oceanobacillus TaxID=182709 RepID=UPI000694964F|nr:MULTISPECIES: S1 RNA-binding domain-containing protein [Oceanobacillus]